MLTDPQLSAVVWAALAKVADKEARRELLDDGAAYDVALDVTGHVGDQRLDHHTIAGKLTVGHAGVRASSTGPKPAEVLAVVLARLNKATREKILRALPEEFAAAGNTLPAVSDEQLEAAAGLLARLRAKMTVPTQGAVACNYSLAIDE